jgi:hypothetical protein
MAKIKEKEVTTIWQQLDEKRPSVKYLNGRPGNPSTGL